MRLKKLTLSALLINCVFIFACIALFTSTKSIGKFSAHPEQKTSLIKIINSTNDTNKLRKFIFDAEESHETTLKALDTHLDVLKLVLVYAGLVVCFNSSCLLLVFRRREELSANQVDSPGRKAAR